MRRSIGPIAAVTLAAALLGFLAASRQPEQYRATARLHISFPYEGSNAPRDPQRRLDDLAARITSAQVLNRTAERLEGDGPTAAELGSRVSAQPSQALDIIDVHAVDRSRDGAERVADEVAEAFREVSAEARVAAAQDASSRLEPVRSAIQGRIEATSRRVAELRAAIEAEVNSQAGGPGRAQTLEARLAADAAYQVALADRDAALEQLRELGVRSQVLVIEAATQGAEVDLAEPARAPASPVSPRPLRGALLTGLVGLLASTSLVWLNELRRPERASAEELSDDYDASPEASEASAGRRFVELPRS